MRSEGLSYGMIIAVELDKKPEFDAIWNWSKTYLYVTETNHPSFGFFAWQARTNGVRMSLFVAPDGEEYYVMALYFAAHRWGSGKGIYDYRAQADELLSRMVHRPKIAGALPGRGGTRSVTGGALFDMEHKMVLFSPSTERNHFSDPCYHLPAFYELWSRWGPKEDAEFRQEAAEVTRFAAAALYENFYCAHGDMENVLKQQVLDLPGDRMSAHDLAGNQLRLWLATLAYLLLERLRSVYLCGSELARATAGTIRLRLLKVAAVVHVSVRRVWQQLSSAFPLQGLFTQVACRLRALAAAGPP